MTATQDELERLAMAYLTGHPTPAETRRFEHLVQTNSDFAAIVREMETFLAPLNEDVEPRDPPPGLFEEILQEIAGSAARPVSAARAHQPWRAAAFAASAIAIISTALHFVPFSGEAERSTNPLMAVMADDSAPELIVVVYDARENRVLAKLSNAKIPADSVWQLWLIREGETAPRSLGLMSAASDNGLVEIDVLENLAPRSDTLAVSLEPIGGSAQTGPSGPILFTGSVIELEL